MAESAGATQQKRFHALVSGRVQGVSFRYHTRTKGIELDLHGYVRNLPDGSVEVVAEGPQNRLQQMLSWLHRGPSMARVRQVKTTWQAPVGNLATFEVRY